MLKIASMASKPVTRHLRSALGHSALFGTAFAALIGGGVAWAPEDPWRMVAHVEIARPAGTSLPDLMAAFMDQQGVRMSTEELLRIAQAVARESDRQDLDPRLLMAVILTESRFRSDAVSEKGAIGLMQILPSTASGIARQMDREWPGAFHLLDPEANIAMGAFYLKQLIRAFDGDLSLALTAYNKGPGYVRNMLDSGTLEATAASFPSSYAEAVVTNLSLLRLQS